MSKLTQAERDKLPLSSFADPEHRKYPILDQSDVDAAAHLVGKASDPEKVKRRIIAIAKRLGLSIPDAWKGDAGKSAAARPMERKTLSFEVKDYDGDSGGFSLYAAAFGNIDKANEKIAPSAFKNLPEFVQDGFLALNHDWKSLPIGLIDNASTDSYGLKLTGRFHSHPEAQAARAVVMERKAAGKSVKCSIGYMVTDDARMVENGKSFRLLKGIDLMEASIVAVPANDLAHVVDVKAADVEPDAEAPALEPDPIDAPESDAPHVCTRGKAAVAAKGAILGDTDEAMACAAFGRLHDVLGYYVHAQIYSDADPAAVQASVGAAVDEYRDTLVSMLGGILIADDPEDGEGTADAPTTNYGYGMGGLAAAPHIKTLLSAFALNHDTSRDGVVTALELEGKAGALASEVARLVDVHRKHLALRVKEGRTLSSATRSRIKAVLEGISPLVDDLEALLSETEPKPKDDGAKAADEAGVAAKADAPDEPAPAAGAPPVPDPAPPDPKADAAAIHAALADFALFDFDLTNSGA